MESCEFIGAKIRVVRSKNPLLVGIEGYIIEETKNTLKILTIKSEIKQVIKNKHIFQIIFKDREPITFSGIKINRKMPGLISSKSTERKENKVQKRCTHPKLTFE